MWKEGLWSVGFPSLEVGPSVGVCVWGLGPARWSGSQRGSPSVEMGPWLGVQGQGLGSARQEGGSAGRGLGPGAQQAPQCLSGQGKCWLRSLMFFRAPPTPHCVPQGLPCRPWTPNRGWVPLGVGTPPLPQQPPVVPVPEVRPLLLLPLPSLPLPQDPHGWRGPRWAEGQARDLSRFLGAHVGRGNLAMLPFDPLPSRWFPNFPVQAWDPFPSPSRPSGAPAPSRLHFSSPLTPPMPHVLPGRWGFLPSP